MRKKPLLLKKKESLLRNLQLRKQLKHKLLLNSPKKRLRKPWLPLKKLRKKPLKLKQLKKLLLLPLLLKPVLQKSKD